MKRFLLAALASLAALLAVPALAEELEAGKHYQLVTPQQPTLAQGKIEVLEFFSYGCPHCADFHPAISDWAGKLGKDVSFRRVPVTFGRPAWARLAKIYYALEATGNLARLDHEVFKTLHEQRLNFPSDEAVITWVGSKGVDAKKFADAFNGFSINSQVQRGDQEATAYRIGGVPAIAVDGRFLMRNEAATSYGDLLRLTDAAIDQVRAEKSKKPEPAKKAEKSKKSESARK